MCACVSVSIFLFLIIDTSIAGFYSIPLSIIENILQFEYYNELIVFKIFFVEFYEIHICSNYGVKPPCSANLKFNLSQSQKFF